MRKLSSALLISACLLPVPAAAQTAPADRESLAREVAALHARIDQIERQHSMPPAAPALAAAPAQAAAPNAPALAAPLPIATQPVALDVPRNIRGATIDSPLQPPDRPVSFQLTASADDSSAQILLSSKRSATRVGSTDAGGWRHGTFDSMALAFSAPLAAGKTSATLGTLDGLADGFKVEWRFTRFGMQLGELNGKTEEEIYAAAQTACAKKNPGRPDKCDDLGARHAFAIKVLGAKRVQEMSGAYTPATARYAWGITTSVAYKKYDFLDPALGGPAKGESHLPVGAKLFGALFPAGGEPALLGSFEYQHKFTEADTAALCPGGSGPQVCPTGPIGPPTRADAYLISAGVRYRHALPEGSVIAAIAMSPTITYDAHSKDVGVDVPVYLVPDSDGNLTGGLRFGWSSSKNKAVIGVFVGSKFGLNQ